MNLVVAGINFKTAPVALRERVSFGPSAVPGVIEELRGRAGEAEIVVVSTCNRTELYAAGGDAKQTRSALVNFLLGRLEAEDPEEAATHLYSKENEAAVEHVMAMASSLDSMVVGEAEILGQVKDAYLRAAEAQPGCKAIHAVFQRALRTAKRVRTETDISHGRVSISSIAVDFAMKIFEDLSEKSVMLVGAGETSELALKSLVEKGAKHVYVVNRSRERGEALARDHGGTPLSFDELPAQLSRADIVISSTSAPHCVIRTDAVRCASRARHGRPVLLLDLAVPRDIETAVASLENVYLYDIDDLQKEAADNLARRQGAVEAAWSIVRQEAAEFSGVYGTTHIGVLMQELDGRAQGIKDSVLADLDQGKLGKLPGDVREDIRRLVHRAVIRSFDGPKKALNRAARNGQWHTMAGFVRQMFGLESSAPKDEEPGDDS